LSSDTGGVEQGFEVLTARDCADWMGCSTEWIRRAINTGVTAADGAVTVKLVAATVSGTGRRKFYRVYRDDFIAFLTAIGWSKLPGQHATVHPFPQAKGAA
jgi:hypothetical protein